MSAFMPVISATQFIELVNQRLPSHHVFKAGMHVFLVRPTSVDADATEFDYSPRTRRASGVVIYVVDHVKSQFLVEPDLRLVGSG
ncbi:MULTISPECIES: hypothetical protein [Burkholderia]|uniref:hypothetical protein n=1 Tax=Burkholderia TaxID=32008 RepID=UPI00098F4E62|nr:MULTISPECIES: hypothetical protein [Burkholderia]AQT53934.1 hypothetical protein BHQ31_28755 [Burkholderia cenocepacia]MBJ9731907.1 hypothetical protein [Burkholderia cenocepacia]MBR8397097.1 hypothetical protein [Burkholderia cenocepacia]MDN7530618.1 hypothetical protein [Burkholderia orbicola]MDN7892873.1 hypothetical protein [Burkholderia cepacia]